MTQPTVSSILQKIEVDNVGSVVVTPVANDSLGNFVREVRVFGAIDADNPIAPQVLTIRLSAPALVNVAVSAPAQNF